MVEFVRPGLLWLLALAVVLPLAWRLARRYRVARVTYGAIWRDVARRTMAPSWRRLLRAAASLLLPVLVLALLVLYAAGARKPPAETPAPLLVALVLDCTPSMRARHDAGTRAELARRRAQEVLERLGPNDRALVVVFREGRPLAGRWLQPTERIELPPTDLPQPDFAALGAELQALAPPPGLLGPEPVKVAFWLGDAPPPLPAHEPAARLAGLGGRWVSAGGVPMVCESFGAPAENDGITGVIFEPPLPGQAHAGVVAVTTRAAEPTVELTDAAGKRQTLRGARVELPLSETARTVVVTVSGGDALPEDNRVEFSLPGSLLATVAVGYPAADGEANPLLLETLRTLLPGRAVTAFADHTPAPQADLLVLDRVPQSSINAKYLLCLGVAPPGLAAQPTADVRPGLQSLQRPPGLRFELPDLSSLTGTGVVGLAGGHGLAPLLKGLDGSTLAAWGRLDSAEVLYCGFVTHQSTLLEDRGGLLLLLRWLESLQRPAEDGWPPFLAAGERVTVGLTQPATLELTDAAWRSPPAAAAVRYGLTPLAGQAELGPFGAPGIYRGAGRRSLAVYWRDAAEQALGFDPLPRTDLNKLNPPPAPDWRDTLPGSLLWLALLLVLAEWLLWLTGGTD
ncbi:MAG: VWA domain-containing protein [Planctomycetes bacterium]|nr:VWA domain-containing protein [Planctomycetota bacterium]